ncbi:putative DNA-binding transcriptional regulator AlpA [Paraburkholderia bannensis]|uniref:Putative DNA-binding transcriptional regulator AlpA n=1 Tax=Paraburkholderia bannensis TaxID=765414 RepID=A0A7W9TSY4_9BURK|nr:MULTISPECIES: AlpA family phage regulatory protein [Paraburkholderia]MBB3255892.1 putative DNA-binding transcriptional regulator AlpA [Paraburkholderia sp. WP4_3_2]MBB6100892.1 putative DNA-binding transcriptional regulator AlpA [Paraburkholderia bannensis]
MNLDCEVPLVASDRLIRLPAVLDAVGLGKTTIYALVKGGEFPRARKVRHTSLWVESEIQEWVRSIAERSAGGCTVRPSL